MLPKNEVNVGEDKAEQVVKLMDALEDHDDVQQVYANYEMSEAVMEKLAAA